MKNDNAKSKIYIKKIRLSRRQTEDIYLWCLNQDKLGRTPARAKRFIIATING